MLPLLQGNRLQSIELLLSNGRTSLGVQLPVTLLWFLGLILSAASYAFSGAFILDYAVSSIGSKLAGIICITAAFIAANTGLAESYIMEKVQLFIYPVSAVIIASAALHRRNAHEISS